MILTARPSQDGRVVAVHPTHWLISTQRVAVFFYPALYLVVPLKYPITRVPVSGHHVAPVVKPQVLSRLLLSLTRQRTSLVTLAFLAVSKRYRATRPRN